MAITNFTGKMYSQFDTMLREMQESGTKAKKPKKFSGGGLLTRGNLSKMGNSPNDSLSVKQQQLQIPLLAMAEIRKRRIK
mgnify:CR=1 FL=1|tara:strand:- start:590 stop:829 length:240 start_codon:yes stop_codon:yes gene_type:complete